MPQSWQGPENHGLEGLLLGQYVTWSLGIHLIALKVQCLSPLARQISLDSQKKIIGRATKARDDMGNSCPFYGLMTKVKL